MDAGRETMALGPRPRHERALRAVPLASATIAFAVYASTAARTITWWDGSSYPLAAVTLGVPGAPGSLLLVLLGWIVSLVPVVHPVAFRLDLFAALIVATLAGLVSWLGARLATPEDRAPGIAEQLAGACAALAFAFGVTPWTYATQFTPYGLSALWTALIMVAALAWWRRPSESSGHARLFLLFLLFGLDLSVHRTNVLLLPAAVLWVAIRSPGGRRRAGDFAAAAGGLVLGLAFHLLLIPMAARHPVYMIEDTSTWAGWCSYVTIGQKGGGFLINLFPRKASFFSVQLADYLVFLGRNLNLLLFLPVFAVFGWVSILRHHPRRALGLMAFFLCAGPGAVVYFNLPQHYMRPIDRHYLPSLVILAPWVAAGMAPLLRRQARLPGRSVRLTILAAVLGLPALAEWGANRPDCDLSRVRFTETFARDVFACLPERAILLTNGDNDSFPPWYLQQAENFRRDVTVVNLPLANTGNYVRQLRRRDPDLAELLAGEPLEDVLTPRQVAAESVAVAVDPHADPGLPAGVTPPDTVRFRLTGTVYGSDRVALDVLRLTRWRRPVYLACTVSPENVSWLWPFARIDGLAFRIIPSADPAVHDVDHLRHQLLERVSYADLADSTIPMDRDSRAMCSNYLAALVQLANLQAGRGRPAEALATLRFADSRVPISRLGMDPNPFAEMRAAIERAAARNRQP
jgi:hypothetical protein